jgi:hypothetical protein
MKLKLYLLPASLLCASMALASPISGTFQMNGVVTATATTLDFLGVDGTTPNVFTLSLGTGSFASENGTNTIHNLNQATEPVNTTITPPQDFIDFTVMPGLPSLMVGYIPMGNGGLAGCSMPASGTVPPQTCTVPGSPITLQNNNDGGVVTGSSATWTVTGPTSDRSANWTGVFTSQFVGQSYQDVLATLAAHGSVTDSYSANVTVSAVPEPGTLLTAGFGMLLAALIARRRRHA